MIKIGITGSLASGKTTASQILSYKRGPLFSADKVVKKLYKDKHFKNLLSKKFNIKNDNFIKKNIKKIILVIESKLMKYFNIIIFIKAKRNVRLKRFKSKNGDKKLFDLLDKKQLNDNKKIKFCNFVVVNEKNLKFLKKKLFDIVSKYE